MWITANLGHWPPVGGECGSELKRINVCSAPPMPFNTQIWPSRHGSECNVWVSEALLTKSGAHELSGFLTANLPLWRSLTESLRNPQQMHTG
jgi:hypothetical protein